MNKNINKVQMIFENENRFSFASIEYANSTPQHKKIVEDQMAQPFAEIIKRQQCYPLSHHKFRNSVQYDSSNSYSKSHWKTKQSPKPFVSIYGKQTRLQTIMKIKTRPIQRKQSQRNFIDKIQDKQNNNSRKECSYVKKEEPSRFDKIMALKTEKPKISSTLVNYHPRKIENKTYNSPSKQKLRSETMAEFTEAQKNYQSELDKKQKEDKQWRKIENEREKQLKHQKAIQQKAEKEKRRKQIQFQNIIAKEIQKIERQRQMAQRKKGAFVKYIYQ